MKNLKVGDKVDLYPKTNSNSFSKWVKTLFCQHDYVVIEDRGIKGHYRYLLECDKCKKKRAYPIPPL